jgi:hypothetical protein
MAFAEEDVLRLDIAVDDAVAVGAIERFSRFSGSCRSRLSRWRRLSPSTYGMLNQN